MAVTNIKETTFKPKPLIQSETTTSNPKPSKSISSQLGIAASALLSSAASGQDSNTPALYSSWDVDVGYLYYEEPEYITVHTYMAMINGNLSDTDTIKLGLVFDTLSGATPTGALPDSEFVSVSGVSGGSVTGNGGAGGKVSFDDTRLAFDASWGHEWKRLLRTNTSAYVSVEGDYTAIGGSFGIEKDNADKSLTYTAAIGLANDRVSRSDETTPDPLSQTSEANFFGSGSRNSTDLMLGVSSVINRRTTAMLNFSYSHSLGYHTDPYKIISIANSDDVELTKVFEKRPDERERFIMYGKIKHELPSTGGHLGLSYRLHADSWGVNSHTFEGQYSHTLKSGHNIEPFARLYHQQAADFYTRTILYSGNGNFDSVTLPEHASSDVRLGEMLNSTLGVKYIHKTSEKGFITTRVGYYHRNFSSATINDDGAYFIQLDLSKGFD